MEDLSPEELDRLHEADEAFMGLAIDQARRAAEEGEVPIGAVVVADGVVISSAHNRREIDQDPSAHAEFSALIVTPRAGPWAPSST